MKNITAIGPHLRWLKRKGKKDVLQQIQKVEESFGLGGEVDRVLTFLEWVDVRHVEEETPTKNDPPTTDVVNKSP